MSCDTHCVSRPLPQLKYGRRVVLGIMDYSPRHARAYKPRYCELDERGEVTPAAMMALFEETAVSHCDVTGWDVFRLRREGFGWILLEGGFEMTRYPRYGERFTIETWLSGARLFYGLRGFEVKGDDGSTIGRAWSLWTFYDLARRRPAPVLDDILAAWKPDPAVSPSRRSTRTAGDESASCPPIPSPKAAIEVRPLDIDTNGHVNNVRYLEWAVGAVPATVRDGYRLSSVEGRYLHEVKEGRRVVPASFPLPDDGDARAFGLGVYDAESGTAAAVASSRWAPR